MSVYRSSVSTPNPEAAPSKPATPQVQVGQPDWILLALVLGLTVFGLIMIYSITYPWVDDDPMRYMLRQGVYAVVGVPLMLLMMRVPYSTWRRISVPLMFGTLGLLFIVLIIGKAGFGATRWFLNGSVQPSEIAKIAIIIYVADWLASKGQKIRNVSLGLLPFSIFIGLVAGLILLQPNMSTAILIAVTAFTLFFIAGADIMQMIITGLVGSIVAVLLVLSAPYRLRRVTGFLDPMADPDGASYHITRALATLNNGGLVGLGLGNTPHKYLNLLPAPHTDSIFALVGEEFGFLGAAAIVAVYLIIGYRGYRIARNAPDRFGMFVAGGITILMMLQAMINVAVITSTIPFTGVPLPFISFGGSSLVSSLVSVGLLLNISRYKREETVSDASAPVGRRYSGSRLSRAGRASGVKN